MRNISEALANALNYFHTKGIYLTFYIKIQSYQYKIL